MDSGGPRSRVWPYSRANHAPVIQHMASMMGQWTNYNLRQYNPGLAHPQLRSDSSSTPGWFSNRKGSALPLAAGEQSPLQVAHQAIMNLALTSARAFFATDLPATITESPRFVSALTSGIAVLDANPAVQSAAVSYTHLTLPTNREV